MCIRNIDRMIADVKTWISQKIFKKILNPIDAIKTWGIRKFPENFWYSAMRGLGFQDNVKAFHRFVVLKNILALC